jgi:hypothetical protein
MKEKLTECEAAWKALGITSMIDAKGMTLAEHIILLKEKVNNYKVYCIAARRATSLGLCKKSIIHAMELDND